MRRRFIWRDGCWRDVTDAVRPPPVAPVIMLDAYQRNPVRSPVDGSVLDSRAANAEHNRRNGVMNVGNDRNAVAPRRHDPLPEIREEVGRLYSEMNA